MFSSFKFNHASVQLASSAIIVNSWLLGGGSVVSQEKVSIVVANTITPKIIMLFLFIFNLIFVN